MFQRILVPVDLSDPKHYRRAVAHARDLAKLYQAHVRVVTVVPAPPAPTVGYQTRFIPPEVLNKVAAEAQQAIDGIAKEFEGAATSVKGVVRKGGVYHEVLQEATDWGADLIVMGSHRPAMSTYLLGSNAARIVRHATCSVLVERGEA